MKPLNPLTMPLQGLQVIEASAGTGKTFTLAALYVRLVLGHDLGTDTSIATTNEDAALMPPQILVMTFTEAATSELRDRVRQRLAQAALYFKGVEADDAPADGFLRDLKDAFAPDTWPACAHRLDMAAQWMDDAAIFTIHGWSSRMLKQHAFDSASLFQQSRVEDSDALRLAAVQDYWRQWFYALPAGQLGALKAVGNSPDELLQNLKALWQASERAPAAPLPAMPDPHTLIQQWDVWQIALHTLEAAARSACTPALSATLADVVAAKLLKGYRVAWPVNLAEWAAGEPFLDLNNKDRTAAQNLLQRFTLQTLMDKGWAQAASYPAFAHIEALCAHMQAEPEVGEGLLQHAAVHIAEAYRSTKNQLAQFDFSDLLQCLYYALQAPDGRLAEAIRRQYPVALVDEFQDTDPWQYGALSKIYGASAEGTGLIMIGDPKQAIYSFRGADLVTYLQAREQAQGLHTLSGNYRSTAPLVAAVNHVFTSADQPFGAVPYATVQACNAHVVSLQVDGATQPALTVWHQAYERAPVKGVFQKDMSDLFASQMVRLLQAGAAKPGEMAVLVRDGYEARAMRQALSARGVRSVYLSERDSVYATPEATDLWRILCAVARPRASESLRAALATRLWGLPFAELEALFQNEDAWDALVEQFHTWQAVWQRQGFLPMLHRVLHEQGIPARLLNPAEGAHNDGERRLTNLMHLGDLLQTASASLQGEAALIRHLEQQLQNPKASGDTAQLRLESDADLVQVVTIHKSKGLQYPLVFLPFVSAYRAEKAESNTDDTERLAEDIRLLYVALTRAERALWLGLAPFKGDLDGKEPKVRSAISTLLRRQSADDLLQCLAVWADCPDIVVAPAPAPDAAVWQPTADAPQWKPALQAQRRLQSRWWTASFSTLTRELAHPSAPAAAPASDRDERVDDALIDSASADAVGFTSGADATDDADTGSVFTGAAVSGGAAVVAALPLNAFPAGSTYGTLLHDLLEWQFERGWPIARGDVTGNAGASADGGWATLLQRKAQRLKLDAPQCALLTQWVVQLVDTPLPLTAIAPGAATWSTDEGAEPLRLSALDRSTAWAEMAFTLPVHQLSSSHLDALITRQVLPGQARSPLQPQQLEGMLIGFMDLVLEHGGRYFVLDYKSNRLDTYAPEPLQRAILAHRYDVQYTLYTLALHRLLKVRLPDYDYDQHVGGALYLFLRGIDQPGAGLFVDRPPRALIEALDAACAQPSREETGEGS